MKWIMENWTTWAPLLISSLAFLVSLLSYLNSKRGRILANQPMIEINHVFDEGLRSHGYLLISLKNLNSKPFHVKKIEIEKHKFDVEFGHGEFSRTLKSGSDPVPKENSFIVYIYMEDDQDLNHRMIVQYKDFENKTRKLISEPLVLKNGKVDNRMNGAKLILS